MAVQFYRKGKTIREDLGNGKHKDNVYNSITQAKKASRKLQEQHGKDCITVVERFPRFYKKRK